LISERDQIAGNAESRATLFPVAEVEFAWASVLWDVYAAMLAIPARV